VLNVFPVTRLPSLTYATVGSHALQADLYLPQRADRATPAIVWLHGGGWRYGSRRVAPDLTRFFAARGFAMVAIDYRLSRRALFPAQIEDVRTAIRWLRSVAPAHGIDPDRIGLWGASAGGHLAALAALAPAACFRPADALYPDVDSGVQAAAIGYAPTDFLQMDAHRPPPGTKSEDPESLLLPRPDMRATDPDSYESLLLGAPIATCSDKVRAANPIAYAGGHAPPFLILHGLSDTTIAPHQSELLYHALAAAGTDVTLALIEGLGHGFLDRNHLDDVGPREIEIRQRRPGGSEVTDVRRGHVFPLIEGFFRTALDPA
jgi:acetyl esterase/lipase